MSGRLVAVTLVVMALGLGSVGFLFWRQHSKGGRSGQAHGHFTLPGWEDVFIGGNPVKDTPCNFLERAKADNCVGNRVAGIGQIGQIEMLRRSDVGIAVIIAQLDLPAADALRKRWGPPRTATKDSTTWCSADGREGAFLDSFAPEYVAPTVVITMTDRAQDMVSDLPMRTARCTPAPPRPSSQPPPAPDLKTVPRPASVSATSATASPLITTFTSVSVAASSNHASAPGYSFTSGNLVDDSIGTSWQPDPSDTTPWFQLDFPAPVTITEVRIANGFQKRDRFGDEFLLNDRIARARLHFDDGSEIPVAFASDARGLVAHTIPAKRTRKLKLLVDETWPGSKWRDLAVSEIEVRGYCECWVQDADATEPRKCDENEVSVWLETAPCDE